MIVSTRLATLELLRHYSTVGQNQTILEASFPTIATYEHVRRLFDLVPGLESCKYDQSSGKWIIHNFKYMMSLYVIKFAVITTIMFTFTNYVLE